MSDYDFPELENVARELKGIDQIIDTLLNLDLRVADSLFRRKLRKFIPALRSIYFRGDGMVSVIDQIIKGKIEDRSAATKYSESSQSNSEFDEVYDAIDMIDEFADSSGFQLPLEERQLLGDIAAVKKSIRIRVAALCLEAEEHSISPKVIEKAVKVREDIEDLNQKIIHADKVLRQRTT